jgi:alkyl hydroperoxide reductase subunit AhpF
MMPCFPLADFLFAHYKSLQRNKRMQEPLFDEETWASLPDFIDQLPEAVLVRMWGDEQGSEAERATAVLLRTIAQKFDNISVEILPRRVNYDFYPVIGVMTADQQDPGVRIIGQPAGIQLTTLIAAIQVVAFRGQTLEPKTRIKLSKLSSEVSIEVLTATDDELGVVAAKHAFGLAVASSHIRAFVIMTDQFPEALTRYSVNYLPHVVINNRVHIDGMIEEEALLRQVALAVKQ